ncbi:MAG: molybdopterin-guanine dinucleotide biosynthesis protein B [Dehalococcoidia bacterium]
MLPVVSIVGKSNAGKTTLVERLVAELKGRGYRVATIKHVHRDFELDQSGKDSWRHAQSGSDAVVISSPRKIALIKPGDHDASIEEVLRLIGEDFDIVLSEGFKRGSAPKIEVHRKELKEGLLCPPEELLAIVSDEPLDADVPQFPWDDVSAIASFIEERLIAKRAAEDTVLFINGSPVPLNPFAKQFISSTLMGMVSALRGVDRIRSLEISVRRREA